MNFSHKSNNETYVIQLEICVSTGSEGTSAADVHDADPGQLLHRRPRLHEGRQQEERTRLLL